MTYTVQEVYNGHRWITHRENEHERTGNDMEGASTSRTYYYARVSSDGQNLASQLKTFHEMGATDRDIITDKISGKDTDRPGYQALKGQLLRRGDTLIVTKLDRLSRTKADIWDELRYFQKAGIRVKALDLPTSTIDWPAGQEWAADMVGNILIEVYATIAEQERMKIRTRQREGLDAMPLDEKGRRISTKKGTHAGRPDIQRPANWEEVTASWRAGTITATEAMRRTGMKRTSFYKLAAEDKEAGR